VSLSVGCRLISGRTSSIFTKFSAHVAGNEESTRHWLLLLLPLLMLLLMVL